MRILLLGARGQVGFEISNLLHQQKDLEWVALDRQALDLSDYKTISSKLASLGHFDWIINAAAYTAVDKAESEPAMADAVNHLALQELAQCADKQNSRVLHFSTDYVFDGSSNTPYVESSETNPMNVYGKTKHLGEKALAVYQPDHLIIRTSWVFGTHGHNFLKTIVQLLQTKSSLNIVADQQGVPTAAKDLARLSLEVLTKNMAPGIYHYCSGEATTWHEFASYLKERVSAQKSIVCRELKAIGTVDYPTPAKRPRYSVLDTRKIQACGIAVNPWQYYADEAITILLQEKERCEK